MSTDFHQTPDTVNTLKSAKKSLLKIADRETPTHLAKLVAIRDTLVLDFAEKRMVQSAKCLLGIASNVAVGCTSVGIAAMNVLNFGNKASNTRP